MKYEKSCGFVVYKEIQGIINYLIIRAINGEYGFPKGHVEADETEHQSAIRELKEETNIEVEIIDGFRHQIEYKLPNKVDVMKQSVYFLGKCINDYVICQEDEVSEAIFVTKEEALDLLTFQETKEILKSADIFIRKIKKI